jgi:hypothetical protein
MKNRKLRLLKDVLKILTPTELGGVVGGTATSPQATCNQPGSLMTCDTMK